MSGLFIRAHGQYWTVFAGCEPVISYTTREAACAEFPEAQVEGEMERKLREAREFLAARNIREVRGLNASI